MKFKQILRSTAFVALGLLSLPSQADDTDIYFETGGSLGNVPLVMLHLEYSSSLASTTCSDITAADCTQATALAGYLSPKAYDDGSLSLFEVLVGVTKRTLVELDGLKVGLLLSNGDDNSGDTDGGYIPLGFVELAPIPADFNPAAPDLSLFTAGSGHYEMFRALDALADPQGNVEHKHQAKETYFELFRYLTGQGILNGYNGMSNFGTNAVYNAGDNRDCIDGSGSELVDEYPCVDGFGTETGDNPVVATPSNGIGGTMYLGLDPSVVADNGIDYISPLTEHCSKVFVINVVDGGGNNQNDADTYIEASEASGGIGIAVANNDPGFVDIVEWLHDKDLADGVIGNAPLLEEEQTVTSYFIANQPQQVEEASYVGGGGYPYQLTDDPEVLLNHMRKIFTQVLSVSTTFVSASIPVNVFNRSEVIDNVYIALFQTDADAQPAWVGNVKKLKLDIRTYTNADGTTTDRVEVVDSLGALAISAADGRIEHSALTFWTNPNGYDVVAATAEDEVAYRDGRSVNRGGAGQQAPGFLNGDLQGTVSMYNGTDRTIYTEQGGSLVPLDWDYIVYLWPAMFDPNDPYTSGLWSEAEDYSSLTGDWTDLYYYYDSTASCPSWWDSTTMGTFGSCWIGDRASAVLAYMRGKDVHDEDGDGNYDEARRWFFGDSLHSRPHPINYGDHGGYTQDNQDIRILVGSNDGYLRMILNTNSDGSESGKELWAFMPREVMGIQKQLFDNAAGGEPSHPYGVDGPVVVYRYDENQDGQINGDDVVWAYFGLRRGGQAYYALNITDPDNPVVMWKVSPASTGFSELGYTFSQPSIQHLKWGGSDTAKPVLIFGGGYDLNKDAAGNGTDDTMGTAIYVVDAETGTLIWKATGSNLEGFPGEVHADMVDSIPSQVAAVDSTGDLLVDRVYVGDTGGTIWRLDLNGNDETAWRVTRMITLGRHMADANLPDDDRRFFHAPDFVPARDEYGIFDAVVIGSGDRADPLNDDTENYMYVFKDRITTSGSVALDSYESVDPGVPDHNDLGDVSLNCLQQINDTNCTGVTDPNLYYGWRLHLDLFGEKSLASPLTLEGVIYFNTYEPHDFTSAFACGPIEGSGWVYSVSLQDATAVFDYDTTNTVEGEALQIEDRRRELLSGGIPSENVYISYRDTDLNNDGVDGGPDDSAFVQCIMMTDLRCQETNQRAAWRLYWYLAE